MMGSTEHKKITLLIIGSTESIYVKNCADLLANQDILVEVLDISNMLLLSFNKNIILNKIETAPAKSISDFKGIYSRWKNFNKLLKQIQNRKYDFVHIFYNKIDYLLYIKKFKRLGEKIYSHIFGSDFNNNPVRFLFREYYKNMDLITIGNPLLIDAFKKYFTSVDSNRVLYLQFGINLFDDIDQFDPKTAYRFEIPENKIVVTLGNRIDKVENHDKILMELAVIQEKIFLIVPLTYGEDSGYRETVKQILYSKFKPENYLLIENNLDVHQLVSLKKITDIFISLRVHDQLNAAMLECLYAGSVIITGDWLPYHFMNEHGVYFLSIPDFESLNKTVEFAINNIDDLKIKCRNNSTVLGQLYSKKNVEKQWLNIYKK